MLYQSDPDLLGTLRFMQMVMGEKREGKIILVSLGMRHIPLFLNCLIITYTSMESIIADMLIMYLVKLLLYVMKIKILLIVLKMKNIKKFQQC